ncbi:MAG: cyclase family protein [candidate division NC10 bacterium]|nr:cyclase family protein [candidate division NC10 bacterium]
MCTLRFFGHRGWMRVFPIALGLLALPAERVTAGALERAMLGKATVVDLTHPLSEHPPSAGDQERLRSEGQVEGQRTSGTQRASLPGDLGTHLDLPASTVKGKPTVAQIPAREFLVHAVLVDMAARVAEKADYRTTVADLQAWERRHGRIPKGSVVLLHTGWGRRWGDPARYLNLDAEGVPRVPGFSPESLRFLASEREIRGVGLDTWGTEIPPGSQGGDNGMRPLQHSGKWQLVNLANLDRLPAKGTKLVIAPLRVDAGSAPARVIAILP